MATVKEVQQLFHDIGMGPMVGPVDGRRGQKWTYTILWFQRGFAAWSLDRNGKMTKKTLKALRWSKANGGKTSKHFRFIEFASKGNGHICIHRSLVRSIEALRREIGRPVGIMSGYRDKQRNEDVGGASKSQHVFGKAFDPLNPDIPLSVVLKLKRFSGLGYRTVGGVRMFAHGDVRGGQTNFTNGTRENPTIWSYD